jgi:hypothetical protein
MGAANNIFRLCGDLTHVIAIFLLGVKIHKTRSCSGLSLKSQLLYLLVYICRYLDVLNGVLNFSRIPNLIRYNTLMKILFLSSQSAIIYYMMGKFRATYHAALDSCRVEFLVIPCLVLAFLFQDSPSGFINLMREVVFFLIFSFFGLFLFSWRQLPYSLNYIKFKRPEKPNRSLPIISHF